MDYSGLLTFYRTSRECMHNRYHVSANFVYILKDVSCLVGVIIMCYAKFSEIDIPSKEIPHITLLITEEVI